MNLVYLADVRLPTEKAHGLQIMQMCAAFASNGHEVTLVVPRRKNAIAETPWTYYGLPKTFRIVSLPVLDLIPFDRWLGNAALWITSLWFAAKARKAVAALKPDLVYSRDAALAAVVPRGTPFIFEAHDFPSKPGLYRRFWARCTRIVTVTEGLRRAFLGVGVPEGRLAVAHDAVDVDKFRVREDRAQARRALGLPETGFLAVYAGHLYPYKGADDLLAAAARLQPGASVLFVGGHPEEVERMKKKASDRGLANAVFIGQVPHARIPLCLCAGDVAVLPTRAADRHASEFLSPLKLFEYLAAGKAIVATDLPSVREVLDDRSAVFVPPGDPAALAGALNALADASSEVARLERAAAALSREHAWTRRAERVLAGLPDPHPAASWYRRNRVAVLSALAAFAIRAGYVLAFPPQLQGGDGWLYVAEADQIRGIAVAWSVQMTTFFSPGFPIFLAAVRALFGEGLRALGLAQALLSSLTVGLTAFVADRLAGKRVAVIAGVLSALYVPSILEARAVYTETLYALFLTLAVFLFIRAARSPRAAGAAVAGGAFVLSGLVREVGLHVALVLAAVFGVWKRSWRLAVGVLAPVAVMLAVFFAYNHLVAASQAVSHVPIVAKSYEATLEDPKSQENLLRWRMYPEGVWLFFRSPDRLADISDGVSTRDVLRSGDASRIAAEAPQLLDKAALFLLHWLLLALAAYGLWRGRLPREAKTAFFLAIGVACGTIIVASVAREQGYAAFGALARYRYPIEPLMLILAASGLERLDRGARRRLGDGSAPPQEKLP